MRYVAMVLTLLFLGGCQIAPAGFPRELGDAAGQFSTGMNSQAVWDNVLGRLAGQVIEPGMESYAGVNYIAGVRITGASGQLLLEGGGHGTGEVNEEYVTALVAKYGHDRSFWEAVLEAAVEASKAAQPAPVAEPVPQ